MLTDLLLALKNAKTQRIMEIAYRNLEKVGVDRNTARILVRELEKEQDDGATADEDYWEESGWDDDEYTPSSTNGDYSPSNPWDAPGNSISMFIRGVYD